MTHLANIPPSRVGIHEPAHRCPACGAGLEIYAGWTVSTMDGARKTKRVEVWCQTCGESLVAVYKHTQSGLKIEIERAT